MPKPDIEKIIKSPEAETFLRMVTKGFYDNSYSGLWMFEAIGREWDEMRGWAEGLRNEIHPQTCVWSVGIWEWMYGIDGNGDLPLEMRRQRLFAKITGVKPVSLEAVRRGVAAFIGASPSDVEIGDFIAPYRFEVKIHVSPHELPAMEMARYIREIKPSHLAFAASVETTASVCGNAGIAAAAVSVSHIGIANSPCCPDAMLSAGGYVAVKAICFPSVIVADQTG